MGSTGLAVENCGLSENSNPACDWLHVLTYCAVCVSMFYVCFGVNLVLPPPEGSTSIASLFSSKSHQRVGDKFISVKEDGTKYPIYFLKSAISLNEWLKIAFVKDVNVKLEAVFVTDPLVSKLISQAHISAGSCVIASYVAAFL